MSHRYWVIGGEYESTAFDRLRDGTGRLIGPFHDADAARQVWESIAVETRSVCTARFTIVREGSASA